MEVWKKMDGMSNPFPPHCVSFLRMVVEGAVEIVRVVSIKFLAPQWCGNLLPFPGVFPIGVHTNRDKSSLKACTFRSKEGSAVIVSSTFRIE